MASEFTRRDLFKKSAVAGAGVAAVPGLAGLLAACANGSTSSSSSGVSKKDIKLAVVTHGQGSDPFWSVVKNGVDQASKDVGVGTTYDAPPTFDMVAMSQLIDAQVAKKPDGLIVSIPDASALGKSIKSAVAAGIPVISINSGSDVFQSLGVLAHVGQTEYEAGLQGGARMGAAGVVNGLCVNQEVGNAALDLRAKGFNDGLAKTGGKSKVLSVDLKNPTDTQQKIATEIGRTSYDGILTLGPTGASPAIQALTQTGKLGKVKLGTFDLSPDALSAIDKGDMLFAIDQQQFLQGYLPVLFFTLYKQYLLMPGGGGVILTGPGFVLKDTAAKVLDLSKRGIR